MHRAGHIESFAIVTEEAISKGIRRIVALTGSEAVKAHHKAELLEKAVEELVSCVNTGLEDGSLSFKKATRMIVDQGDELSAAVISQWRKENMRTALKTLKKTVINADRTATNKLIQKAVDKAKELIGELGPRGTVVVVEIFEVEGSSKALDSALKQFKSDAPNTAAMLFSVDGENGKLVCLCQVPDVST